MGKSPRILCLIVLLLLGLGTQPGWAVDRAPAEPTPADASDRPVFAAGDFSARADAPAAPIRLEPPERNALELLAPVPSVTEAQDPRPMARRVDRALGASDDIPPIFLLCCSFLC